MVTQSIYDTGLVNKLLPYSGETLEHAEVTGTITSTTKAGSGQGHMACRYFFKTMECSSSLYLLPFSLMLYSFLHSEGEVHLLALLSLPLTLHW